MSDEVKAPEGTAYTLTVPLDRKKTKSAVYHLKEVDEQIFMAVKSLIDSDRDFDGVRMFIREHRIGGDDPGLLNNNFVAIRSASVLVMDLLKPVEGELKKN